MERGKHTAAESAASTSEVLDHAADEFSEHGQETLARATKLLSGKLSDLAQQIEHRSIDDLSRDAMTLARNNPGLFIAGGLALGIALSRFVKATAPEHRGSYGTGQGSYGSGQGSYGTGQGSYGSGQGSYGSGQGSYGSSYGGGSSQGMGQQRSEPTYGSEAAVPSQGSGGGGQSGSGTAGTGTSEGARGPARAPSNPGNPGGATGGSASGNPMGKGGIHE